MVPIYKNYPCNPENYSRRSGKVEYIVIHYVGATGGAKDNAMYYNREYVGNSAHFFVGHASENAAVYQSVPPTARAWHCGSETGRYVHPYCRNDNSIGVEICCKYDTVRGWYFEPETVAAAIELTKQLMEEYGVPVKNVLRHYDVTGKTCPAPFVLDTAAWESFRKKLTEEDAFEEIVSPADVTYGLAKLGLVLDTEGMLAEMQANPNGRLYWLARKALNYIKHKE